MLSRYRQYFTEHARSWWEKKQQSAALHKRAADAIKLRRVLEEKMADTGNRIADLQAQAETALEQGDRQRAEQLLGERQRNEQALAQTQESLAQCRQEAEQLKADLLREEQEIFRRNRRSPGWTPALFPGGRNSPESAVHLAVFLLVGAIFVGIIQWMCR
jgi:predicted  nucleic acid-binding Zn-ribbon protein